MAQTKAQRSAAARKAAATRRRNAATASSRQARRTAGRAGKSAHSATKEAGKAAREARTAAKQAVTAAKRWAQEILKLSPMSIRASKQVAMRGRDLPVEQALNEQVVFPAVKAMLSSADFVEGPKAFAEKRKPVWSGR